MILKISSYTVSIKVGAFLRYNVYYFLAMKSKV